MASELPQLVVDFWNELTKEWSQTFYEFPIVERPDPIIRVVTKPGYIFDDLFWQVFQKYPFQICHVSYFGPERTQTRVLDTSTPIDFEGVFELFWSIRKG